MPPPLLPPLPLDQTASPSNIDRAIELGLQALDAANIKIRRTPLFLVVGLPRPLERRFRLSSEVGDVIRVDTHGLPVRWYGDNKALWLTLTGVSAISHDDAWTRTPTKARNEDEGRSDPVVDDESANVDVRGTLFGSAIPSDQTVKLPGHEIPSFLRPLPSETSLEDLGGAMTHLVRALKRVRDPVVPVNGVLFHLPFAGLFDKGASRLQESVKTDMTTLQRELEVKCMCLAVFSGIERSDEFTEFVRRLDSQAGQRRFGCSFPPLTHLQRPHIVQMHAWLVDFLQVHVLRQYRNNLTDPDNAKIFCLLDDFRRSKGAFIRLFSNAFPEDLKEPFFFGGSYLASLEKVSQIERPFLDGVLSRLSTEHDDMLCWTVPARQREQQQRKRGTAILFVTALLAVASLFFAVATFRILV